MKYLKKFEYFQGWNKNDIDNMINIIKKIINSIEPDKSHMFGPGYVAKTYSFNKRFSKFTKDFVEEGIPAITDSATRAKICHITYFSSDDSFRVGIVYNNEESSRHIKIEDCHPIIVREIYEYYKNKEEFEYLFSGSDMGLL